MFLLRIPGLLLVAALIVSLGCDGGKAALNLPGDDADTRTGETTPEEVAGETTALEIQAWEAEVFTFEVLDVVEDVSLVP